MLQIGDALISLDVIEEQFLCNLSACHGNCCVFGDSGAPLEDDEVEILKSTYPGVKKYLQKDGIKAIKELGTSVIDVDGDKVTPLINGKECAYTIFENNIALCGIEKAYNDGMVDFKKPLSCHLYPIRVKKYNEFQAVNYDKWDLCKSACDLGKEKNLRVYKFLKEPLIRKFGVEWYNELENTAEVLLKQGLNK